MDSILMTLLQDYKKDVSNIMADHMRKMILYGSFARGDNREGSDIDVMFLVDLSGNELDDVEYSVWDMTYDFNMEHGVNISAQLNNEEHFKRWRTDDPFYHNVDVEGMLI